MSSGYRWSVSKGHSKVLVGFDTHGEAAGVEWGSEGGGVGATIRSTMGSNDMILVSRQSAPTRCICGPVDRLLGY